jgi:hypothetical protein
LTSKTPSGRGVCGARAPATDGISVAAAPPASAGLLALHLQRHPALEAGLLEDGRDALVIEIQRVPDATAVVGLGLDDGGVWRQTLDALVGIAGPVAGVEVDAEPRRVDVLVDPQQGLDLGAEAPVVLQGEHHTGGLGVGQAGLDAVDAPLEGVLVGVALDRRLVALDLHQVVERLDGVPAPGVEPDRRHAEPGGERDALLRVVDRGLALRRVGRHEVLVNREHRQRQPVDERRSLELVEVGRRLAVHLPVEQLDAVEAEAGRLFDDLLDGVLLLLEVPVGIGRHREPDRARGGGLGRPGRGRRGRERERAECGELQGITTGSHGRSIRHGPRARQRTCAGRACWRVVAAAVTLRR